jgi:recombination protein RecT
VSNQVSVTNVYEIVENQAELFLSSLSDGSLKWEKEKAFAVQLLQSNDYLNKISWSNQDSLRNAIINISSIGISLNPALKHAYLVPREGKVHLDISYIGLMHLAQKTGSILWGRSVVVRKNDLYENQGIDVAPSHKYNPFDTNLERGEIVGVYCVAKASDGSYLTDEMNIEDIHKVRASSKAFTSGKSCPWIDWEEEMMRKTVVKRASKYWPAAERLNTAIDVLNDHEGLAINNLNTVIQPLEINKSCDFIALISLWIEENKRDLVEFCLWVSTRIKRDILSVNDLTQQEAELLYLAINKKK